MIFIGHLGVRDYSLSRVSVKSGKDQTAGIKQVNLAICQMDDVTQQNAILVKQAAAATESLEEQTQHLTVTVAHFKMNGDASGVDSSFSTEPVMKAQKIAHVPVGHLVKLEPQPAGSAGWEEF